MIATINQTRLLIFAGEGQDLLRNLHHLALVCAGELTLRARHARPLENLQRNLVLAVVGRVLAGVVATYYTRTGT